MPGPFRTVLSIIVVTLSFMLVSACVEQAEEIGKKDVSPSSPESVSASMSIADLKADAEKYAGQEVTLIGNVAAGLAFEFVDEQPYLLEDGTGEVWIITREVMPPEGTKVTVTGTVRVPYQIKGRRYEVAVIEKGTD